MAAYAKTIPQVVAGVSQQPPHLRALGHADDLDNYDPSLTDGLRSRAGARYVASFPGRAGFKQHFVHIAPDHDGLVLIGDGVTPIKADRLVDTRSAVTAYLDADGNNVAPWPYLTGDRATLKVVEIGDFLYLVNTSVPVATTTVTDGPFQLNRVQKFADLPATADPLMVFEVAGSDSSGFTSFYVKWENGAYTETRRPNDPVTILDPATLPCKIYRSNDFGFTVQQIKYPPRTTGSAASETPPSFVGRRIRDLFVFRNRVGFITDDSVILSRPGDPFNFWRRTATAVMPDDPIDVDIPPFKAARQHHAIPFNSSLLLFTDQGQMQLGSSTAALTPETVRIDPTTEYECSPACRPVGLGSAVYFAADAAQGTRLREYYVEDNTVTNEADDVSQHVPSYIPKGVVQLAAVGVDDLIVALPANSRKLYLYRTRWAGSKQTQASWFPYSFEWLGADGHIVSVIARASRLYVTVTRGDGTLICMELILGTDSLTAIRLDDGSTIHASVDLAVALQSSGVYDAASDTTEFQWAGLVPTALGVTLVKRSTGEFHASISRPLTNRAVFPGNLRTFAPEDYVLGVVFPTYWRLSPFYPRDRNGEPILNGRLQITKLRLAVVNMVACALQVTPRGRSGTVRHFRARFPGGFRLRRLASFSGYVPFAVMTNAVDGRMEVRSESPFQHAITALEYIGNYAAPVNNA